jgi:transposase-like protein
LRPKAIVRSRLGDIRVLRCVKCNYRFRSTRVRDLNVIILPEDLLDKYFNCRSLQALRSLLGMKFSRSTLHRKIKQKLIGVNGWRNLVDERIHGVGGIMGIDTTNIKVGGKVYAYLHVADLPSKTNLVYQVLPNEKAQNIIPALSFLKARGYRPRVSVTDLAEELLKAIKTVYPQTIIQGCVFHLRYRLDRELPTRRAKRAQHKGKANRETLEKARMWDKVKSILVAIALSEKNKREDLLARLKALPLDERAKETVENFLINLSYYHPPSEMQLIYGCPPNMFYNNLLERCMGEVKQLQNKVRGFKKLYTTQKLIDALWSINKLHLSEEGEEVKTLIELTLDPYTHVVRLMDIEDLTGISLVDLKRALEKAGYLVTEEYAFSSTFTTMAYNILVKHKPKNLAEAASCLSITNDAASMLITKLGLKTQCHRLDYEGIRIDYGGRE